MSSCFDHNRNSELNVARNMPYYPHWKPHSGLPCPIGDSEEGAAVPCPCAVLFFCPRSMLSAVSRPTSSRRHCVSDCHPSYVHHQSFTGVSVAWPACRRSIQHRLPRMWPRTKLLLKTSGRAGQPAFDKTNSGLGGLVHTCLGRGQGTWL